ncbi:GerAB/ArcD/ProY family transporter [Brevibacillus sp. NRS-1366]|uniref:GerAB/ArcD/ProY family transporter n=1 Tax=Brevibacillus sp. NRS-1366 TaxID=3233899 RepID=UPI003D22FED6
MKLSGLQIFWIMVTFETGNTLLLTTSPAIGEAQQDVWISYLIAGVLGIFIAFAATRLSLLYSGQTLIQFSQTILPKWMGKILLISYFIQWYSVIGVILREFADFTITILFFRTPMWLIILTMLLLMIFLTYQGGIEGIGRCSELFGPIILVSIFLVVMLSLPNTEWNRILPVYVDNGMSSIWKATLLPASFFGECVMLTMLLSFMEKPEQGPSRAMWGVGIAGLVVFISTLCIIFVFGPALSAKMSHPFFDMARYISIAGFIQNIDLLIVLIWIMSVFIKLSLYFFICSYGTAQWLNIKDWRKLIWGVALVVFVQSLLYPDVTVSDVKYVTQYWIPYAFTINMVGIPLILWLIGTIRKKYSLANYR